MKPAESGTAHFLDAFRGRWRLARRIVHADGTVALADGGAEFVPDGEGLRYREAGTLRMPGATPLRYERDYLWRAAGQGIAVLFDDGRPFHDFSRSRPSAGHDCAPDRYDVTYDFALPDRWHSTWQVRGPRKSYRMETTYSR